MHQKHLLLLLVCFAFLSFFAAKTDESCGSCALKFQENKGQWHKNVLYKAGMPNGSIFVENNAVTFKVFEENIEHIHPGEHEKDSLRYHAFQIEFLNANQKPLTTANYASPEYYNYFIGNNKERWASNVKAYYEIEQQNIYSNIDLKYYSTGIDLKYDLILHPGSNVADIELLYKGTDSMGIKNEQLQIYTSVGTIVELAPYAYQKTGGKVQEVKCRFILYNNKITFSLPDGYDKSKTLIIDPQLVFSTYSGSTADNFGFTATYDNEGNLYGGGRVYGDGQYPTTAGAFQTDYQGGNFDMGISKYNSDGTQLIYATYIGGASSDQPYSLITNDLGELYILGTTFSTDFPPTPEAFDTTKNGGWDIVVSKLNKDGTNLLSSTFIGGDSDDGININAGTSAGDPLKYNFGDGARGEIKLDEQSNPYIAICTESTNFPVTQNAPQAGKNGPQDGVVFKMNSALSELTWSTYLGGTGYDAGYSLQLDDEKNVYVTGGTNSANFPVTDSAYQTTFGGGLADGFVTLIKNDGSSFLYSTYFGSDEYDQSYFIDVDRENNVWLYGQTEKTDSTFIKNTGYSNYNSGQFVSKLTPELDSLTLSTTFGSGNGQINISPTAFLADVCDKIYISGWGGVSNYIGSTFGMPVTSEAYQPATDGSDFYLAVFDKNIDTLLYATFFGIDGINEHVDGGTSRFDKRGIVYQAICGSCWEPYPYDPDTTITTPGAYSRYSMSDNCNLLTFKFDFDFPPLVADFTSDSIANCDLSTIQFNNTTNYSSSATFKWYFGDGDSSTLAEPQHTYSDTGTYYATLIVTDPESCNNIDSITLPVIVWENTIQLPPNPDICPGEQIQIGADPLPFTGITYNWEPATDLSNPTISNPLANPDTTTVYMLLVNYYGCTDTFFQKISVVNAFTGGDSTLCSNAGGIQIGAEPDTNFTYLWQPGSGLSDSTIANPIANPNSPTTYILNVSNGNCIETDTATISVVTDLPDANFTYTFSYDCEGIVYNFQNLSNNADSIYWNFGGQISSLPDPEFFITNPGDHELSLIAINNQGCADTSALLIEAKELQKQFENNIPNAFTPNEDGHNECFNISYLFPAKECFSIDIYNRWGEHVFESTDPEICWDGIIFSNGKKATEGTYYYIIKIRELAITGYIELIR